MDSAERAALVRELRELSDDLFFKVEKLRYGTKIGRLCILALDAADALERKPRRISSGVQE